jgi:hypothetical protein
MTETTAEGFLIERAVAPLHGHPTGIVHVREMNAPDDNFYRASLFRVEKDASGKPQGVPQLDNLEVRLLVLCLCDGTGKLLYKREDIATLGASMPRRHAKQLFAQAERLNELGDYEAKKP